MVRISEDNQGGRQQREQVRDNGSGGWRHATLVLFIPLLWGQKSPISLTGWLNIACAALINQLINDGGSQPR